MNEGIVGRTNCGANRASAVSKAHAVALDQPTPARTAAIAGPYPSQITELTKAVEQEAEKRPEVPRLKTHPGVGPLTALTYVLIIGTPKRFHCGKQIGTYVGMIPCEDSSAHKQRLGHISKQGNSLLRYLLVESGNRYH